MKNLIALIALGLAMSLNLHAQETKPAEAAPKPYKLDTCAVSGEKLGGMGDPFTFVHKDHEVKLCCKSCKKKFDKDPEKYMAKVIAADKAAKN